MGFEQKSYQIHSSSFDEIDLENQLQIYKNWFDKPTTDLWRHLRMLVVLDPFLNIYKNTSWITIGDGRFGTSATYIERHGSSALATDIGLRLLEIAKSNQMITEFAYANAEQIPFADEAFDFAYCKQSYHHFPRPMLAVYEMLRVSKKAIIFTEPHDFSPPPFTRALLQKTKHRVRKLLGKSIPHHDTGNYEEIGNYIYSISVREFEKVALGLGLPCIAYKRFDDIYLNGVEAEIFSPDAPLYKKIKSILKIKKLSHSLGLTLPNSIQMVVFKTEPAEDLIVALKKDGFKIVPFSSNPYL